MGMSAQLHAPVAFTPGKEPRYTLNRVPFWTIWRMGNLCVVPEFEPRTGLPYTYSAVTAVLCCE
jgi:hypothetical protein